MWIFLQEFWNFKKRIQKKIMKFHTGIIIENFENLRKEYRE